MLSADRLSGVLLPVFSMRSHHDAGVGDFGAFDALFSWLNRAQQKWLMVLPLLPTTPGDPSPYSTRSAFGLNPLFVHLPWVPDATLTAAETARLDAIRSAPTIQYDVVFEVKYAALERAFAAFEKRGSTAESRTFDQWCLDAADWLENYALYAALSEAHQRLPWWDWPKDLATRAPAAMAQARLAHRPRIRFFSWLQWLCADQWQRVRLQAQAKRIQLCGDEPFIIGQDSADCWAWPQYLRRDARLGVPPDDFSLDGQDWGLPFFDFEALNRDDNAWLKARARHAAATYDVRRIDHAIGYFRQYVRDAATPKGYFVPKVHEQQQALGRRNFEILSRNSGIVAEDLGVIPRFARDTLAQLGLPGYQVMRWTREDGVYRDPRHFPEISLVTTGTHDTDSMREWWQQAPAHERQMVCRTWPAMWRFSENPPATLTAEVHESLLRAALEANSRWCILPWQDVLGEAERTNTPGTVGPHNWAYRMRQPVETLLTDATTTTAADWLAGLTRDSRRA